MNLLTWNCRGAGNPRFPGLIKDCIRLYNVCFFALLEPRISGQRAANVINRLGFDGEARVDAVGFSGGILCLWKRNRVAMDVLSTSQYCITLKVNPRSSNPWLLSIVYGSPQERFRDDLWDEMRSLHSAHNCLPWCVIGDFNSVLHPHEKTSRGPFNHRVGAKFGQCISECSLIDLGFNGPMYTWQSGTLRQRLDCALGNSACKVYSLLV